MQKLSQKEFLEMEENSFEFYSILPTDNIQLDGVWITSNIEEIAKKFLDCKDIAEISEYDLDMLACGLLKNRNLQLSRSFDWFRLADMMAVIYSRESISSGSRKKKMRAGRVNFFIRNILECNINVSDGIISRSELSNAFPWDWFPINSAKLVIDSGTQGNVHYYENDKHLGSWGMGLPTQVDQLSKSEFSITSCFTKGWYLWRENNHPSLSEHHEPVVVVFDYEQMRCVLDITGCIYNEKDGSLLLNLPLSSVWRARFIEGDLYVFSLEVPYSMLRVCMRDLSVKEIGTSPVIIPNDICKIEESYYMIDKMQGKVFSFNDDFIPINERMSFGRGEYALYDPISLRAHNGYLWVLSWMTNSITKLTPF